MNPECEQESVHLKITEHIFANSPTMLGLCLTTVGLIKIYSALQRITTVADDFLAVCLVAFVLATVFSYLSLRSAAHKRKLLFAKAADVTFLSGLAGAAVVALIVVLTVAG